MLNKLKLNCRAYDESHNAPGTVSDVVQAEVPNLMNLEVSVYKTPANNVNKLEDPVIRAQKVPE